MVPVYTGLGVAYACAFILKRFQLAPGADSRQGGPAFNATIYEVALVVMSAYLAYLVSETLALSGIVTLYFSCICHTHYSYYSVTKEAAITLKRLFEFAAFLSEMFVFAYLGLQVSIHSSTSCLVISAGSAVLTHHFLLIVVDSSLSTDCCLFTTAYSPMLAHLEISLHAPLQSYSKCSAHQFCHDIQSFIRSVTNTTCLSGKA